MSKKSKDHKRLTRYEIITIILSIIMIIVSVVEIAIQYYTAIATVNPTLMITI